MSPQICSVKVYCWGSNEGRAWNTNVRRVDEEGSRERRHRAGRSISFPRTPSARIQSSLWLSKVRSDNRAYFLHRPLMCEKLLVCLQMDALLCSDALTIKKTQSSCLSIAAAHRPTFTPKHIWPVAVNSGHWCLLDYVFTYIYFIYLMFDLFL